ncbi:MAG: hypothetical protein Q9160_008951 [Pyrenula sp. 1 TL-2023]
MEDGSFQFAQVFANGPMAWLNRLEERVAHERLKQANCFLEMLLGLVEDKAKEWEAVDKETYSEYRKLDEWARVLRQHGYAVESLNGDEDLKSLNLVQESLLASAKNQEVVLDDDSDSSGMAMTRANRRRGGLADPLDTPSKRRRVDEIDT